LHSVALGPGQGGAGEQVLVDFHGPVRFTAGAEKVAQGNVGLDGFAVYLKRGHEGFDGAVLLVIEQVVQASEVILGQ
jgi:hypothetical protein